MIEIWHNPRCSKSRQALALLQDQGINPRVHRYLDDPPTDKELRQAIKALDLSSPLEMMRTGEKRFKELGLTPDTDAETLIRAMVGNPILIERPIVLNGGRAVIGRPPENVLTLL